MSRTILYLGISLDGYVAGTNDDISWLSPFDPFDYGFDEFFSGIGALIQGRRSYDIEVEHGWEYRPPVPTFVLSHTVPERKPERSDIVFTQEDIAEVLKKAKQLTDKDIFVEGGANVAQQFLSRGLIDEIALSVVPIILGDGIRLFDNIHKQIALTLRDVKQLDKGLVQLLYTVSKQ